MAQSKPTDATARPDNDPADTPPTQPTSGAGEPSSTAAGQPSRPGTDEALRKAQAEAAEYKDLYLRSRAEVENVRKRAQEDVAKAHKFGIESFAESLIPVKDSLEAALSVQSATVDAYRDGIGITLRQLGQAFERNHLIDIAPAAAEKFDPNRHQAISMVPSPDVPAQHVVATLQKGYLLADRVLRPALVTVSQGPAQGDDAPTAVPSNG